MKAHRLILSTALVLAVVFLFQARQTIAKSVETALVSSDNAGQEGNGTSKNSFISGNGRYVAFQSDADNLVIGAIGTQVYVRDLQDESTVLISKNNSGDPGNAASGVPSISVDGSAVAFQSNASNLISGVSGTQIYVHDLGSGTTSLISRDKDNADTPADGPNGTPYISADGNWVAFPSKATNLVADTVSGTKFQIFLHDRTGGTTTLISKNTTNTESNGNNGPPSLSADGSIIAFASDATDLVDGSTGIQIYVYDRNSDTTTLVSKNNDGNQGNGPSIVPILSADGRYVVFTSDATNLDTAVTATNRQVYLHDRTLGTTSLLSKAQDGSEVNGTSGFAFISPDGRYVAFQSDATNLTTNDNNGKKDIFVRDILTGRTRIASVSTNGVAANNDSTVASISTEGKMVAFESLATNLTTPATSGQQIFVRYEEGMNILFMVVPALAKQGNTP